MEKDIIDVKTRVEALNKRPDTDTVSVTDLDGQALVKALGSIWSSSAKVIPPILAPLRTAAVPAQELALRDVLIEASGSRSGSRFSDDSPDFDDMLPAINELAANFEKNRFSPRKVENTPAPTFAGLRKTLGDADKEAANLSETINADFRARVTRAGEKLGPVEAGGDCFTEE